MLNIETIVRTDIWDVEPRVRELNLSCKGIRRVRDVAMSARANATSFHPANASGTFAYQEGVWSLRDEFVGDDWILERPGGVEAIVNLALPARVAFANVDLCCDPNHDPQPISNKGSGAEKLCESNLFDWLPSFTKEETTIGVPLFYVMVDPEGAVELSRPTIVGNTFGPCIERNFISTGDDDQGIKTPLDLDSGEAVDDRPMVSRKAA